MKNKTNINEFYREKIKVMNNGDFVEKCFLETYAVEKGGQINCEFEVMVNEILENMEDSELKNKINQGDLKYKYNTLGKLEKILIAIFYTFIINELIKEKDTKLLIDIILNISKIYISLYSYKILNGIMRTIVEDKKKD